MKIIHISYESLQGFAQEIDQAIDVLTLFEHGKTNWSIENIQNLLRNTRERLLNDKHSGYLELPEYITEESIDSHERYYHDRD